VAAPGLNWPAGANPSLGGDSAREILHGGVARPVGGGHGEPAEWRGEAHECGGGRGWREGGTRAADGGRVLIRV
jgi:hypothetical protein